MRRLNTGKVERFFRPGIGECHSGLSEYVKGEWTPEAVALGIAAMKQRDPILAKVVLANGTPEAWAELGPAVDDTDTQGIFLSR